MIVRALYNKRMWLLVAVWLGSGGGVAMAQAVKANPSVFEVVSIRPSDGGLQRVSWGPTQTGYSASNVPVARVILQAYLGEPVGGVLSWPVDRVKSAPAWVMNAPYDIAAKADEATTAALQGMSPAQQLGLETPMLRALLEDRFKLVAHTEPVEVQGYALVVSQHGSKMKEIQSGEPMPTNGMSFGGPWRTVTRRTADGKQSGVAYLGITMAELTAFIGSGATPVVDQTGLTGRYDVELPLMDSDPPSGGDGSAPAPRPDIAHGYDWEAMGLEMKPIKAPVLSVVIDHIERPSEN